MIHSATCTVEDLNEIITNIDNLNAAGFQSAQHQPYTDAYAALQLIARQTELTTVTPTIDSKHWEELLDQATDSIADFTWDHGDIIPEEVRTLISNVKELIVTK